MKTFDQKMQNLGYSNNFKSFLIKSFGEIEINITKRKNAIESIVAYKNSQIVEMPQDILIQVKDDIQQSL